MFKDGNPRITNYQYLELLIASMKNYVIAFAAILVFGLNLLLVLDCSLGRPDLQEAFVLPFSLGRWYAQGTIPDYPLSATFDITPLMGQEQLWLRRNDVLVTVLRTSLLIKNLATFRRNQIFKFLDRYVFQICGYVTDIPMDNGVPCYANATGEAVHYPVYQYLNEGRNCVRLGKDTSEENVHWSLVDAMDPSVGVIYSYLNGEEQECGNLAFEIELDCWDDAYNVPEEETVMQNGCVYHLAFNSLYGCPMECGVFRGLCGGRGKCKFDTETREPHCYCQKGWTGYACNERGENSAEGFTNTTLVLVVVLVLLVFVELGVFLMWDKVKRLRLDPSAYANFAAADELA